MAAAFVCYLFARNTDGSLLAISHTGFMHNLFNQIPIGPLEGGPIVTAISPRIWFRGVPILGALFLWKPSPMLLVVAILAAPQLLATIATRMFNALLVQRH
jgi:Zn-dependent protease